MVKTALSKMTANIDRHTFVYRAARTANKGLKEMAADEQVLSFVHFIYFCSGGQ